VRHRDDRAGEVPDAAEPGDDLGERVGRDLHRHQHERTRLPALREQSITHRGRARLNDRIGDQREETRAAGDLRGRYAR